MLAAVPGLVETPGNTAITPLLTQPDANMLSVPDRALAALGRELRERGYRFTTITPASHKRVNARPTARAVTLQDIFGWSRPFAEADLPASLLIDLAEAGALDRSDGQLRSTVRFSTLGDQLFAHSAFPTEQGDAVFFGPDTYRFARALGHSIATLQPRSSMRILDVGAGSGAGGLHAAALLRARAPQIVLTDINHNALRFSRINAAINDVAGVKIIASDLYADIGGQFDLIISNPPYLVDPLARLYRHGGGKLGSALSVKIAEQGIERLAPGGRLLLYTGSAIVDGVDALYEHLRECAKQRAVRFSYEEIDPDVFGEELESPPYDRADRIAVVAASMEVA
jgi:release factor glutamine methyltransferase